MTPQDLLRQLPGVHPHNYRRLMNRVENLEELAKNIKRGWRELARDTTYLQKLTDSMVNRVNAIIDAEGDITKY